MTLGEIIYKLLIGPLELFFEVVFAVADRYVSNPAYAIILLSLAMNFLVLPLYRRADALQAEERDRENSLGPWIRHIKKTFKGDERFMMLQAYYKENNYKPSDSLKGSISLLLEIPFFIAAYHFLSNLETLKGVSFGPIQDLGAPDGLISIGTLPVNLLPILMTLINVISAAIYMRGFPIKSKIQTYGIAAIFLIFLYNSPAGLVFYWTLNNIFSLFKNVFYKLQDPAKVLRIISSAVGAVLLILVIALHPMHSSRMQLLAVLGLLAMQIPVLMHGRSLKINLPDKENMSGVFYGSSVAITILTGVLIPSAVINDSTQEFINTANYFSPLWYVVSAAALAAGTFLVWFGVFYRLSSEKGRQFFALLMAAGSCCALADYMFFGKNYGNFSSMLIYDIMPVISKVNMLLNLIVLAALSAVILLLFIKKPDVLKVITIAMSIALVIMSGINVAGINKVLKESTDIVKRATSSTPEVKLSKTGKNVIVIMMDRQIGHFVPFIMNEKPELIEKFDGFTYYPNSFSYGTFTNVGTPGLYGGYEYIPEEMNKREDMKLGEKHNEALKVMPKSFSDAGFEVTLINPTYAGYEWIPDLSVFDDIPGAKTSITNGKFTLEEFSYVPAGTIQAEKRKRNFFCYSIFKTSPMLFQYSLYNGGAYNEAGGKEIVVAQTAIDMNRADGYLDVFMEAYAVLCHLPDITSLEGSDTGTYTVISNDLPHSPMMLQKPDYIPAPHVDNRGINNTHKTDGNGNELNITNVNQQIHYDVNMAAMLKLADWLDFMRKNNVYDNTRIIIVSDHGSGLNDGILPVLDYPHKGDGFDKMDAGFFDCVLMVKDFESHGFTTDNKLISNADVPFMAMESLIPDMHNPYTGKPIISYDNAKKPPELIFTVDWQIDRNNGNAFLPSPWFTVHRSIYEKNSWEYLGYH